MALLRSERLAAALLLFAALIGLLIANSAVGADAFALRDQKLGPLTLGHWVSDGLLALFFLVAAIELRHEFTHGALDSRQKALVPVVAALGGVVVPALLYLAIVRDPELVGGWPIPTATDIAFALGVLALFGRGLDPRVRALLLALAVVDDLIAIGFIAVLFTEQVELVPLLIAAGLIALVWWLGRQASGARRTAVLVAMLPPAVGVWIAMSMSGVHPTIAGVALGLVLPASVAVQVRQRLEPISNLLILPLFAVTATLIRIPTADAGGVGPVFWAIAIALPVGKLIGIAAAGILVTRLLSRDARRDAAPIPDLLVVAALGGIGFTVSLLMNELAFRGAAAPTADGVLGVLAGSGVAIVLGATLTALRARSVRRASSTR